MPFSHHGHLYSVFKDHLFPIESSTSILGAKTKSYNILFFRATITLRDESAFPSFSINTAGTSTPASIYAIGNIRIDRDEFSFPDVYRGQQPSLTFDIANLSDRPYEPVLMHLPPYLKMEAEPKVLLKGKKGTIKLTLDASQLKDYGLTQTSVYLSRFSGDKVSEDNEIPVSAILLPDFSRMTEKDSLNAPAMHISETDIDLSIPLIKKNKVSHDILIANSGKTPLVISKLQVFNSSVGVSLKKTVLPPDGMTKLKVTIRKRDVGNKKHHLRILMITNDPLRPKVEINIKR